MITLTKKYRVIWDIETLVCELDYNTEHNEGSETINANIYGDLDSAEFDTLEEMQTFVSENELIYIDFSNTYENEEK